MHKEKTMFDRILVAIDGTPQHREVLEKTVQLAGLCQADVHVISVNDPIFRHPLAMVAPAGEYFDEIAHETHEVLAEAQGLLSGHGLRCTIHPAHGRAAEEIASLANSLKVDLIVIGHRYLSWLDHLFEHSVGWDLLGKAPCSVLVVLRRGTNQLAPPALASLYGSGT
jgi:nucleotide-binding universal stress UspA family protein